MSDIDQAIDLAMAEAQRAEREGNLLGARDIYARVLVQIPSHRKAKKLLRAVEKKLGSVPLQEWELKTLLELCERDELARALPMAQRLSKRHPGEYMLHNVLGTILLRQGQFRTAEASFARAVDIRPDLDDVRTNLAHARFLLKDWAGSQEVLEVLLAENPGDADLQYRLGYCLAEQQELARAAELLMASTRTRPLFGDAHNTLGTVLKELGRTSEAITSVENALEIDPDDPKANQLMSTLLKAQGRDDEAIVYSRKAGRA